MQNRPSNHEMCKKVSDALAALLAGRFSFGTRRHISGDLEDLQLDDEQDIPVLLIELLKEIQNADPIKCYAGGKPPQRSYHPETHGLELWAYSWHSGRLQKAMYVKFAMKNEWYIYFDCHDDNPEGGNV